MEHSACELSEIVNAILDISRLDTGRPSLLITKTDLVVLMDEIRRETENLRENSPLTFHWQVSLNTPPIFSDPVKIKVILKNLLSNAIKFTAAGSVTVTVIPQQNGVECSIADTGIGISPDSLSIIFEPFRQAESPMTRRYGGIGLGLYVVRRLLELIEGTISVESTPGQGATFRVRLPFTIAEGLTASPFTL